MTDDIDQSIEACWRVGARVLAEDATSARVCDHAMTLVNESDDINSIFQLCQLSEIEDLAPIVAESCERSAGLAKPISIGEIVAGMIESGDTELWVFDGLVDQTISVRMDKSDSVLDSVVTVFDSKGVPLLSDDQSGGNDNALICAISLPATGRYFVMASGYQATAGEYELELAGGPCG